MSRDEPPRPTLPTPARERHTGIFASPTECAEIRALMRAVQNAPAFATISMISRRAAQIRTERSTREVRRRLHERVDTLAREHGLPRISGHYGIDLETGEFLRPTG